MNSIPVHKLQDRTNLGFLLKAFTQENINYKQSARLDAHRDDHYIFFILLKGAGSTMVDFEKKTVRKNQLYYILPEQIHYRIKTIKANGWFIAIDPSLVNPQCRNTLESRLGLHEPITLMPKDLIDFDKLLTIIYGKIPNHPQAEADVNVLRSLIHSFLEMAASTVRVSSHFDVTRSRPAELAGKFKKLLTENIRNYKSPSDYAEMLHISEPYLNESVKKTTGSPVSFWIKYEIIIEAKRMLYFSDLNVKEIAGDLGFENHSYFSRLFRKEVGMTALDFRKKFNISASEPF